jgi:hypothetical protein
MMQGLKNTIPLLRAYLFRIFFTLNYVKSITNQLL